MDNKTKGFEMCNAFANEVRKEIVSKCKTELKAFQTPLGKALVVQDYSDEYKDILLHLQQVQRILDRILEEK